MEYVAYDRVYISRFICYWVCALDYALLIAKYMYKSILVSIQRGIRLTWLVSFMGSGPCITNLYSLIQLGWFVHLDWICGCNFAENFEMQLNLSIHAVSPKKQKKKMGKLSNMNNYLIFNPTWDFDDPEHVHQHQKLNVANVNNFTFWNIRLLSNWFIFRIMTNFFNIFNNRFC